MNRIKARMGYAAAGFTVAVAIVGPMVWFTFFTRAAARTSLRVDPMYTGGEPARTITRDGYQITVYKPVPKRAPLSTAGAFVQVVWKPASTLPPNISETLDLEGDGQPDCVISFQAPRDRRAPLRVTAQPLSPRVLPMRDVSQDSLSSLIARVNDSIIVRVPLR